MSKKIYKVLSLLLCFLLIFEQSGFAQMAGQLDISGYLAGLRNSLTQDKFRPLHLRYLSYDTLNNNFRLLLDKGDLKDIKPSQVQDTTQKLLEYFFVGVSLPNSSFWVNLRPDSPDNIVDPYLAQTDVGKILLEADLQLKKDTAKYTSPENPKGKEYWDKLYKKAGELFGYDNVTIPTLTRPWIVPDEIIVREANNNAYIYKATLKVLLEQDHLKDSAVYNFQDDRLKELNGYSSQLIRELIIPELTREINTSKRYAPLRQVYYSLILAQWFKQKFSDRSGFYGSLIDRRNLNGLTSKGDWSKTTYFKEYQKSFQKGEYNITQPISTPFGQTIRSYFSGGIDFGVTQGQGALATAIQRGLVQASTPGDVLAGNSHTLSVDVNKGGTFDNVGVDTEAIKVGQTEEASSPLPINPAPKGTPAALLRYMHSNMIFADNPKISKDMAEQRGGNDSLRTIQRELKVLQEVGLVAGDSAGYYLVEWLKNIAPEEVVKENQELNIANPSDEQISQISTRISLQHNGAKEGEIRYEKQSLSWEDTETQTVKSTCKELEDKVHEIKPYLSELIERLFQYHRYGSYGSHFSLESLPQISKVNFINSTEDLEQLIGKTNVYWSLFSDKDKRDVVERLRKLRETKSTEYIGSVVKAYVRQNYGVECEVVAIYVNGSFLYRWSNVVPPADVDNVVLIRVNKPNITIREVLYEIPESLRNPQMNISGMAVQSVNDLNSDHPHTQTALGSIYFGGIPILEKEHLICQMDRKNMLFNAFKLLEDGRIRLSSTDHKKQTKWFGRIVELKGILYKLGLLDKFDHHLEWERFDKFNEAILSNDTNTIELMITEAALEYLELRTIIENALMVEKRILLKQILAEYSNCDTQMKRQYLINDYVARLEKANGSEYGFPLAENTFRAWVDRVKLAADKEALEREHRALLTINDLAINLSLGRNSPFSSVQQSLKNSGIISNAIVLGQEDKNDTALELLFSQFTQEKDLARAYNYLTQIISHKEKGLSRLIDLIYGSDAFSRQLALYALGEIGSSRVVPFILDICSAILKSKIIPNSSQEAILNFGIEALGKCNSEKAVPFLFDILEQGGTKDFNATVANSYRAMGSLIELAKNPAIKFLVIWRIKEAIQLFLDNHDEKTLTEDTSLDYKAERIMRLLAELPIAPGLKKGLLQPLINLYSSKKDSKKNSAIFGNLVELGSDLDLFSMEDLTKIYEVKDIDVGIKAQVIEAMGKFNNPAAKRWLENLDFSNEADLRVGTILFAARRRTLSLVESSSLSNLSIWEAGFHGLYDLNLSALGHRDSGGQIVYQVELTRELGKIADPKEKIVLVTRGIVYDQGLNRAYPKNSFGLFEERINDRSYIVRLPFGPNSFIPRSEFWNYQISFKRNLQKLVRAKGTPSIIHLHSGDACTVELAKWAVENGIPVVFTIHSAGLFKLQSFSEASKNPRQEVEHMQSSEELLRRIIAEDTILNLSDKVILSTNDEFDRQLRNYSSFKKLNREEGVAIIPPGIGIISTKLSTSARGRLGQRIARQLGEDQKELPCFGVLSKFEERKNTFGLIKIWYDSGLYKKSNLLIAGGPKIDSNDFSELEQTDLYKKISQFIAEHPYLKGKIVFLGNLNYANGETREFYNILRDGIPNIIGRGGVFVQPSTYEPFGLAIIEAMASRIVTVATLNGGPKEIISHGVDGYLINPQDESSFATILNEALQEAKTGEKGIASNGEMTFNQRYKWGLQANYFLKLYRSIVEKHKNISSSSPIAVFGENPDSLVENRSGLAAFDSRSHKLIALFSKNGALLVPDFQARLSFGNILDVLEDVLGLQLSSHSNENYKVNIKVSNSDLVVQQEAWALGAMELNEATKETDVYINKIFLEALKMRGPPEQQRLLFLFSQFLVEQHFFLKNNSIKTYEDFFELRGDKYKDLFDFVKESAFGVSNGFMKKMPMYTRAGRLKTFEDWFGRTYKGEGKFIDLGLGIHLDEKTNIPMPPTTFELARKFPNLTICGVDRIIPAVAINIAGKWAFFNEGGKLIAMMEQASEGRLRRIVFERSDLEAFNSLYKKIENFDRAPKMIDLAEEKAVVIFKPYDLFAQSQGISNIRFISSEFYELKDVLLERFDYGRIFNVLAHYDQEGGSQILDSVIPLFKHGAILFEGQSIGNEGLIFSEYESSEGKWVARKIWLSKNCSGILTHATEGVETDYIDVDLLPVLSRQNRKLITGLKEAYAKLNSSDSDTANYGNTLVNSLERQKLIVQKEHMDIDVIGVRLYDESLIFPGGSVEVPSPSARKKTSEQGNELSNTPTSIDRIDKKGGIDLRGLPIITQPMNTPRINMPLSRLDNFRNDPEWNEIQNMVNAGIIPSGQRIKDYLQSCCQKRELNGEISRVLNCIADIMRIEEDRVSATDQDLKNLLVLLESGKPEDELEPALSKIKFSPQEPELIGEH